MATTEERVSRLEDAYEHLATKADLATFKGEVMLALSALTAEVVNLKAAVARIEMTLLSQGKQPLGFPQLQTQGGA